MIIYNVTTLVKREIEDEFVLWMKNEHINEVLQTGMFTQGVFTKINGENTDGESYSMQYYCESREKLDRYYAEFAPELREKSAQKFGRELLSFRTELDIVEIVKMQF